MRKKTIHLVVSCMYDALGTAQAFTQLRSTLSVCVCACVCVLVCVISESAIFAAAHRLPARSQVLAEAEYQLIHMCVRPPLR